MLSSLPDIPGYDVEAELGRGGMGIVYRVRHRATGRVLALKMILCGREVSFQDLARFRIEAEAMACLNHPNIVKIRDVGVCSGYPYFALEFAEKGSLKQVTRGQPQPAGWSADLVKTLAVAMQHAHGRGMLHRDLKPANILILGDGTPKISDFGLVKFAVPIATVSESCCTVSLTALDTELYRFAREFRAQYRSLADASRISEEELTRSVWDDCATRTGSLIDEEALRSVRTFLEEMKRQFKSSPPLDDLTNTGAVMGSPNYMAPEQASGNLSKIGPSTDIYALGGILYELLTGRPPLSAKAPFELLGQILTQPPRPPREIIPTIPSELEAICLRCLQKETHQRYPSASALADDLQRFLNAHPHLGTDPPQDHAAAESPAELKAVASTHEDDGTGSSSGPRSTRSWWPFSRSWRR